MNAIILNEPGETDQLVLQEMPMPVIQSGEVLIQVKAASVNPVDIKTRRGTAVYARIKDQHPIILGWDVSGIVTESQSPEYRPGDEVFGMVSFPGHGKAYAEFVAAPAAHLALKPSNITHAEAAAATLAALTAWQTLVHHTTIQPGQKVLIHAAAGGVGHFAVQLARHFGAIVTGTSSAKNKDFVLSLGADAHIDYQQHNIWDNYTGEFDFVYDTVGGDNIDNSLKLTKRGGTMITIPLGLNEDMAEKAGRLGVHAAAILVKSDGGDMKQLAALLEAGALKAHVSAIFSFADVAAAHQQIESGRTVGKVVLSP